MSTYYYLVAGLSELSLEDGKLNYSILDFKREIYPELSDSDKRLIDLFYLKFDNDNLLKLIEDREAVADLKGNFTSEELSSIILAAKEGDDAEDKRYPVYFSRFLVDYFLNDQDELFRVEDLLSAYYFDYAMKCRNRFIASWFEFSMNVNNILLAFSLRKYKQEIAPFIIGENDVSQLLRKSTARDFGLSSELSYFEELLRISEVENLVERERKTDLLKWKWMEEASFFDYFTIERIFVFLLQLEMVERWVSLDRERGMEMFRQIIKTLKDELQLPKEFIAPKSGG